MCLLRLRFTEYVQKFEPAKTLIKRIDVHNSTKGDDGLNHIPIDISFTAVGIINIPTEKELLLAIEEMKEKPLKTV